MHRFVYRGDDVGHVRLGAGVGLIRNRPCSRSRDVVCNPTIVERSQCSFPALIPGTSAEILISLVVSCECFHAASAMARTFRATISVFGHPESDNHYLGDFASCQTAARVAALDAQGDGRAHELSPI